MLVVKKKRLQCKTDENEMEITEGELEASLPPSLISSPEDLCSRFLKV